MNDFITNSKLVQLFVLALPIVGCSFQSEIGDSGHGLNSHSRSEGLPFEYQCQTQSENRVLGLSEIRLEVLNLHEVKMQFPRSRLQGDYTYVNDYTYRPRVESTKKYYRAINEDLESNGNNDKQRTGRFFIEKKLFKGAQRATVRMVGKAHKYVTYDCQIKPRPEPDSFLQCEDSDKTYAYSGGDLEVFSDHCHGAVYLGEICFTGSVEKAKSLLGQLDDGDFFGGEMWITAIKSVAGDRVSYSIGEPEQEDKSYEISHCQE